MGPSRAGSSPTRRSSSFRPSSISPDTTFHHAQVYVAYVTDPLNRYYSLFQDLDHKPNEELWHPLFWAQVGMKLHRLHLRPEFEARAEVTVTGPLGRPEEQAVSFAHEARGAYGDLAQALQILPRERYRLDVRLPDGRRYTSETRVPSTAGLTLPDTLRAPASIMPGPPEEPHRVEYGEYPVEWTPAPADEATLTVWGVNHSLAEDYRLWGIRPEIGEGIPYEDRDDHVRTGPQYTIQTTEYLGPPKIVGVWAESSSHHLVESHDFYFRLYQLDPALGLFYAPEDNQFYATLDGDPWAVRDWNNGEVVSSRDASYLPSVSNILRVGPDGRPLPQAESDAVGVFGAFSARYARRVLVADRDFDPFEHGWEPAP